MDANFGTSGMAPEVQVIQDHFQVTRGILATFSNLLSGQGGEVYTPGGLPYPSSLSGYSVNGENGNKRDKGSQTEMEWRFMDKQSLRIAQLEKQLVISEQQKGKLKEEVKLENDAKNEEIRKLNEEVARLKKVSNPPKILDTHTAGAAAFGTSRGRQEQLLQKARSTGESSSGSCAKKGNCNCKLEGHGHQCQEGSAPAGSNSQDVQLKDNRKTRPSIVDLVKFVNLKMRNSQMSSSDPEHKKKEPTTEARYKCEKCPRSFNTRVDFKVHKMLAHGDSGRKAAKK